MRKRGAWRAWVRLLAFVACTLSLLPTARAQPSAADVAMAKKNFETGLTLYKEGAFAEALAAFRQANQLAPRASIQRNIAQCHRDMRNFAEAYDAYAELLARYGPTLKPAEAAPVKQALEELARLTGTIRIGIAQEGALVHIDGKDVGATPIAKPVRVSVGGHHVTVTKPGFEPLSKDVTLRGSDEVLVDDALEKEVLTGHLVVAAAGGGDAHVLVDGADVGRAPWAGDLAPGVHVVEARGATTYAAPRQVDVARRARVEVTLVLEARVGKLQVDAHAIDARIDVDGARVGSGVWEGTLPAGKHELTVTLAGYDTHRRAFLVHAGETFVEDVHLRAIGVAAPAPTYRGLYADLDFIGLASPGDATNGISASCPGSCDTSKPLGAALAVHVGHAWGWIAVEGVVLGTYDSNASTVSYTSASTSAQSPFFGPARTDDYRFHRFGGGGALGARVLTKDPHVRFTFATALGAVYEGNLYTRNVTAAQADPATGRAAVDQFTTGVAGYTAPILLSDVGVLVGSATGAKLHVGLVALVELVGDGVTAPGKTDRTLGAAPIGTPSMTMASGAQFFLGPVIGLHFGE